MSADHTQKQTTEEQRRARELSMQKARPPAEIPGYTIQRLLGTGAYGEVWIGVDRNTGRRVAIKFYTHRSRIDWTSLAREVEKLVYLSADRYVVQLLDVGWEADPPYYVMDYIENGSLEDLLQQEHTLPVAEASDLFYEIAVALLHAHGKGVLHCDLKPANILLDEDRKPRLADFGQSRLSHEQTPALGTLFYMAPEQADLNAVPDARWDVYALGAIFHRMLTGEPPFHSEDELRRMEEAGDLDDRLARYQRLLRSAPFPTGHRRAPGVDRELADVIDRCLAVNPQQRFANVQAVLDALHARAEARIRRPLVLLGFVGPVLLLCIMALFGLRGYEHAMSDSEEITSFRAHESNRFAAKFAARSIQGEIERYFHLIRAEADAPELSERFHVVAESDLARQLNRPDGTRQQRGELRPAFLEDPQRRQLNEYLERRLASYLEALNADPNVPKFASMLALDAHGRMLAAAFDNPVTDTSSVGWNYAYRTYVHGGPADLPGYSKEDLPESVSLIRDTHLSAAFLSTVTGTWKVAVSTPIFAPGQGDPPVGVVAFTFNLGDFAYFRSSGHADRFAVLIDGREGPNKGVILQHPMFDVLRQRGIPVHEAEATARYRLSEEQLQRMRSEKWYHYQDPLQQAVGGEPYGGNWIAALETVHIPDESTQPQEMIVLVQERYEEAIAPVKHLGLRLKREGLWALLGVLGVVLVLWYIVLRMLYEPRSRLRRSTYRPAPSTPRQPLTTLPWGKSGV